GFAGPRSPVPLAHKAHSPGAHARRSRVPRRLSLEDTMVRGLPAGVNMIFPTLSDGRPRNIHAADGVREASLLPTVCQLWRPRSPTAQEIVQALVVSPGVVHSPPGTAPQAHAPRRVCPWPSSVPPPPCM